MLLFWECLGEIQIQENFWSKEMFVYKDQKIQEPG